MNKSTHWKDDKIKEGKSLEFVKGLFSKAKYDVMNYGIENHNSEIVKLIKGNYNSETNLRLMCMPDFVIVDLVEVKYREHQFFNKNSTTQIFGYRTIKNYLKYWNDTTLIIVMNVNPFILAIPVKDIDWNRHYLGKDSRGKDDLWLFNDIHKEIWDMDIWPRITKEIKEETLEIIQLEKPKSK